MEWKAASSNWGEGVENSIKRNRQEKQQENTWNTLIQVGNYIEKGAQMIADGLSDFVKENSKVLIEEGPEVLGDVSTGISVAGYSAGIVASVIGTPVTGGAIFTATNAITGPIDMTVVGLKTINYIQNPSLAGFNDLGVDILQNTIIYKTAKTAIKYTRALNYIKLDYSPILIGGPLGF